MVLWLTFYWCCPIPNELILKKKAQQGAFHCLAVSLDWYFAEKHGMLCRNKFRLRNHRHWILETSGVLEQEDRKYFWPWSNWACVPPRRAHACHKTSIYSHPQGTGTGQRTRSEFPYYGDILFPLLKLSNKRADAPVSVFRRLHANI